MLIIYGYVCMETHLHLVNDIGQAHKIADTGSYAPGGSAANKAIAAARNGARVTFVGTVGDDVFGKAVEKFFTFEGIQVTGLAKSNKDTGLQVFTHQEGEPPQSILYKGANEDSIIGQIPLSRLDAKALLLLEYEDNPIFHDMLAMAKEKLTTTMLCCTPENYNSVENADYIIMEATEIKPKSDVNMVSISPCRHYAYAIDKGGDIFASELKAEILGEIADDTGVYDSFVGSFASCIQAGFPLDGALRYAHVAAWITGQKFGANAAIPHLKTPQNS